MAKERLKSPRARLFIALDLPEEMRSGIEAWGRDALVDPALRRLPAASLHITLVFLGYRAEKEIGRIAATVEALEAPSPRIQLREPVARPPRGRARLFALPVDSPGTVSLQADLESKLATERLHDPEKRPFWPHLTIARVRPEARGSKRPTRVQTPPGRLPQELLRPTSCRRVALYRSELKPQGAQYVPLAQVELSEPGRQ
ncbi:MAG: RNA 2',3'-cyclic phosphodiesterase [Solirubrobacterales bacterium]